MMRFMEEADHPVSIDEVQAKEFALFQRGFGVATTQTAVNPCVSEITGCNFSVIPDAAGTTVRPVTGALVFATGNSTAGSKYYQGDKRSSKSN